MGENKVMAVRIEYDGYDLGLDRVLEAALVTRGFELIGTGFNLVNGQRDLSFCYTGDCDCLTRG